MSAPLMAITLTAPWSVLAVAKMLDRVTLLRSWDYPGGRPQPGRPHHLPETHGLTIKAGKPPKLCETRTFRVPASVVGKRVVIHSGKGDAGLRTSLIADDGRFREPYATAVAACGYSTLDPWGSYAQARWSRWLQEPNARRDMTQELEGVPMPLGACVGVVTFTGSEHTIRWWAMFQAKQTTPLDFLLGNWDAGRFAWPIVNPIQLPEPIPARGAQMFWAVQPAIESQIMEYFRR